jgi:hypothetical protein
MVATTIAIAIVYYNLSFSWLSFLSQLLFVVLTLVVWHHRKYGVQQWDSIRGFIKGGVTLYSQVHTIHTILPILPVLTILTINVLAVEHGARLHGCKRLRLEAECYDQR